MDSAPDRDAVFQALGFNCWCRSSSLPSQHRISPPPHWLQHEQHHILVMTRIYGHGASFYLPPHLVVPASVSSSLQETPWQDHPHLSALFIPFIKAFVRSPGLNQGLHSQRCIDLRTTWSRIYGYFYSIKLLVLLLHHYTAGAQS